MKEFWQPAVDLRGSIESADYKRYVLPIIFAFFLAEMRKPAGRVFRAQLNVLNGAQRFKGWNDWNGPQN